MTEYWRGQNYNARCLLLLGESAYSWIRDGEVIEPTQRHAIELVEDVIENFPSSAFMTKLSRALTDEEWPNQAQLESAWANVAFGNYVQHTVGTGARTRPTTQMWAEAKQLFPSLLENLRPKNIVVLGKEMWSLMPNADLQLTDDVQGYKLSTGEICICWAVSHPTAGLSWKRLAALIKFACDRTSSQSP